LYMSCFLNFSCRVVWFQWTRFFIMIGHFKYLTNIHVLLGDHIMQKWWNTIGVVRSKDTFVPLTIPHPISEANCTKVSKVQLESWHAIMAKPHDLLVWPTIDWTNVIHGVVIMHNEEGMFQLKRALTRWY